MKKFVFKDTLPASKSLLNRALIALSYDADLQIEGDSQCEDVQLMQQGLIDLLSNKPIECGHAGTVLRFLAVRASRMPGTHVLRGSERLFSRPQEELLPIFGQLGVDAKFDKQSLTIISRGWRLTVDGLQVNAERSSQFASAVMLNAWGLKFPLHMHVSRKIVSEGYLRMTINLLRQLGMRIEDNGAEFFIPANQKVTQKKLNVEIDLSSAFAVSALGAVAGEACIQNFPAQSLQPDAIFVQILKKMGVPVVYDSSSRELRVSKAQRWSGVSANLSSSPDLLPVLAVLCALADSESEIVGVGHLKYKESSRLERSKALLELMGAKVEVSDATIKIAPVRERPTNDEPVIFDVDQDHRMAMAVTVAAYAGYNIRASDLNVVNKSFPEFVRLLEGQV
jgi:3-phosphoshikimate 1-carboxyvinyltransferase